MIPVLLITGLIAGTFARGRVSLRIIVIVGVVVSLAFGVVVGVNDGSVSTFGAGSGLALLNFAAGALIGGAIARAVAAVVTRRPAPTRT